MEFFADINLIPTSTISVNPPGGTHTHHHGHPEHSHLPLPTDTYPTPTPKFLHATGVGKGALWVFFALFVAGLAASLFLASRTPKKNRFFHGVSAIILTVSALTYLSIITHLGISFTPVHSHRHLTHLFREIFVARWIDYLITSPLIFLSLARLAGISPASTLTIVLANIVQGFAGWAATEAHGGGAIWGGGPRWPAWVWFAVFLLSWAVVWGVLINQGRKAAVYRAKPTAGLFYLLTGQIFILSLGYAVLWILTKGLNVIPVNAEIIVAGVLDVANKIGFTHLLLLLHKHDEAGPWTLPGWWAEDPEGAGADGRGVYGAVAAVGSD
ncbi:hypothetical protein IAT38_001859 [Cryptococcus sp. DSM 104549]